MRSRPLPALLLALALFTPPAVAQGTTATRIEVLRTRFGLRSITGDAATLRNLEILEEAYSRFPEGALRDLEVVLLRGEGRIEVKKADAQGNTSIGKWQGLGEDGELLDPREPLEEVAAGRVTHHVIGELGIWNAVHEAVHHLTIHVDPAFGREVVEALGYRYAISMAVRPVLLKNQTPERDAAFRARPSGDPVPPRRDMDLAAWRPVGEIPDHWFPTNYSRKKGNEHLTEVVTAHLAGDRPHPTDLLRPEFHLRDNPELQGLLETRLGPARNWPGLIAPEEAATEIAEPPGNRPLGFSLFGI